MYYSAIQLAILVTFLIIPTSYQQQARETDAIIVRVHEEKHRQTVLTMLFIIQAETMEQRIISSSHDR